MQKKKKENSFRACARIYLIWIPNEKRIIPSISGPLTMSMNRGGCKQEMYIIFGDIFFNVSCIRTTGTIFQMCYPDGGDFLAQARAGEKHLLNFLKFGISHRHRIYIFTCRSGWELVRSQAVLNVTDKKLKAKSSDRVRNGVCVWEREMERVSTFSTMAIYFKRIIVFFSYFAW